MKNSQLLFIFAYVLLLSSQIYSQSYSAYLNEAKG
ncbi:unnamed protein product, partial [marine sediment metagenome]